MIIENYLNNLDKLKSIDFRRNPFLGEGQYAVKYARRRQRNSSKWLKEEQEDGIFVLEDDFSQQIETTIETLERKSYPPSSFAVFGKPDQHWQELHEKGHAFLDVRFEMRDEEV